MSVAALSLCSGLCRVLRTTWFISGTCRRRRSCRNCRATQVAMRDPNRLEKPCRFLRPIPVSNLFTFSLHRCRHFDRLPPDRKHHCVRGFRKRQNHQAMEKRLLSLFFLLLLFLPFGPFLFTHTIFSTFC